ncbi:MAG: hypothetical protein V2J12_04520 [Gammaproteobacteria bacterium]|jgi:hypothetical protein|nr:hypothetical protein [Gammaproteobacteria bacterium]
MDESLQQLIALGLVAAAVGVEWLRRRRSKRARAGGCDTCRPRSTAPSVQVAPLRFYQRNKESGGG